MTTDDADDDYEIVYTKTIRLRNGRVLYAAHYGKKAFRIKVKRK